MAMGGVGCFVSLKVDTACSYGKLDFSTEIDEEMCCEKDSCLFSAAVVFAG